MQTREYQNADTKFVLLVELQEAIVPIMGIPDEHSLRMLVFKVLNPAKKNDRLSQGGSVASHK